MPKHDLRQLSRASIFRRLRKQRQVRVVVVGATPGRCGSTQLVAHLQKSGANVSHESGIVESADHVPGLDPPDPLTMYAKPDSEKLRWAQQRVERWVDRAATMNSDVAGDVSVNNTQTMEAFLKADQRVHLVVQVRDPKEFATSVMSSGKQDGLPGRALGRSEGFLLTSRGTTAASVPS